LTAELPNCWKSTWCWKDNESFDTIGWWYLTKKQEGHIENQHFKKLVSMAQSELNYK